MKNEIVTIGAFAALTFIEPYAAVGALGIAIVSPSWAKACL